MIRSRNEHSCQPFLGTLVRIFVQRRIQNLQPKTQETLLDQEKFIYNSRCYHKFISISVTLLKYTEGLSKQSKASLMREDSDTP